MMPPKHKVKFETVVVINGYRYKKQMVLGNPSNNVPSRLVIDRLTNHLFFCINSNEPGQIHNSIVLNLATGLNAIIPDIQNGFATAVDPEGSVYLGGSDGIFEFDYATNNIKKPGILEGVDIFAMYFHKCLYFVETANQSLFMWKDKQKSLVDVLHGHAIQYFVVTKNDDIVFVNSSGVYMLRKGTSLPLTFGGAARGAHFRGVTIDSHGAPYLIAQDGIYSLDMIHQQVVRSLPLRNGCGLAFDNDNNIIYSDERSLTKLVRQLEELHVHKHKNPK